MFFFWQRFFYRRHRASQPHIFFPVLLGFIYDVAVDFGPPASPLDNNKKMKKRLFYSKDFIEAVMVNCTDVFHEVFAVTENIYHELNLTFL